MPSQSVLPPAVLATLLALAYDFDNLLAGQPLSPLSYDSIKACPANHFRSNFGLDQDEFEAIYAAMNLPTSLRLANREILDGKTAFLMLLGYLRGRPLLGLESQFGWSASRISKFKTAMLEEIMERWAHLLDVRHCPHLLSTNQLNGYSKAIKRKAGVQNIWGFVDGTMRPTARPTRNQGAIYNGWKHMHALKYQIIITPDGLIYAQGPWDGSENDWTMWKDSAIHTWLERTSRTLSGRRLFLYGDKGYYEDHNLITPFRGNPQLLTADQEFFNLVMSKYRITVEWAIGSIAILFPRLNNRQQQKVQLTPVALDYQVACLLRNALSCLKGNTTSQYFGLDPPDLGRYFM